MNTGLVDEAPDPKDYEFKGSTSLDWNIMLNTRNWSPYTPPLESQQNNVFDTWSCATFATIHALCTLAKAKFDEDWDMSERFTAVLAGTVPDKGTSLRSVLESVRRNGVVPSIAWPFTEDMDSATFFEPVNDLTRAFGKDWLSKYTFGWEWVSKIILPVFDKDKAYEALKYSPLITAVDVNSPIEGDFVQNTVNAYNHAKVIVAADYGVSWSTVDSYTGTTNKYVWDYQFHAPAKISLQLGETKKTLVQSIIDWIFDLFRKK